MGLFRFWKGPDINQGLKQFEETPGAVLLDVRSPGEYRQGRLPGSQNLPLQAIDCIGQLAAGKGTPLFVSCHSGARSRQAAMRLRQMGYSAVWDIGGLLGYRGKVVR